MWQIPVFKAERDAGLEHKVRSSSSLILASEVRLAPDRPKISEQAMAVLRQQAPERARASANDIDLHYIDTILVSIGWNKNDDVFDRFETWAARHTPTHKQLNYEHDCSQIVGHIIKCSGIDEEGKPLADESVVDDLPAKFHLLTGGVLYKLWQKPELQERMDTLIAEIGKGEWFVSMECLFKGFDYALKGKDGICSIVARNEETAFLTKHLRAYEGDGKYGDYTVGRLVRNIVFSGKGLVKNPANPDSIILAKTQSFVVAKNLSTNFTQANGLQVYSHLDSKSDEKLESDKKMAIEVDTLQKQLDALKGENEQLKASLAETNVKDFKARAEKAESDKAAADELLKKANAAITAAESKSSEFEKVAEATKAKLAESEVAFAEIKSELTSIYAEQKKGERVAKIKAAFKVVEGDAEGLKKVAAFAESVAELSDEKFAAVLASMDMMTMPAPTNRPQDGNTQFPHGKVTPVPSATKLPAAKVAMGSETDASGELAAAATDLSQAQSDKTPALSTVAADSGVNSVQSAIASYFGIDIEKTSEEA